MSALFPNRGRELVEVIAGGGAPSVKDIATGTSSSNPSQFTRLGSAIYFAATTATLGRELWKYESGVVSLVRDIYDGAGNSEPTLAAGTDRLYVAAIIPSWAGSFTY